MEKRYSVILKETRRAKRFIILSITIEVRRYEKIRKADVIKVTL
jgi:hypothetical protein